MLIDQDKELKNAVLNLSVPEKDKLLLKLISKDVVLLEQLRYKLIDALAGDNTKLENAKREIDQHFKKLISFFSDWPYPLSPGELMMNLRSLSGIANDYLLVTKDKVGDVDLRIYIFENLFDLNLHILKKESKSSQKLLTYIASRIGNILQKLSKLHEDYQFDFNDRWQFVLNKMKQTTVHQYMQKDKF